MVFAHIRRNRGLTTPPHPDPALQSSQLCFNVLISPCVSRTMCGFLFHPAVNYPAQLSFLSRRLAFVFPRVSHFLDSCHTLIFSVTFMVLLLFLEMLTIYVLYTFYCFPNMSANQISFHFFLFCCFFWDCLSLISLDASLGVPLAVFLYCMLSVFTNPHFFYFLVLCPGSVEMCFPIIPGVWYTRNKNFSLYMSSNILILISLLGFK